MSAARKRSSGRRRSRRGSVTSSLSASGIWLLGSLLLLLGAGILGLKALQTGRGRMMLADHGVAAAEDWARERLQGALVDALVAAGASADSIAIDPPASPSAPSTLRCRAPLPLLECNLRLTQAVEAVGGRILRGRRRDIDDAPTLELYVGTARLFTQRVLLHEGRREAPPMPMPLGRLALVIDDFGYSFNGLARRVLALDIPLTVAILPELRYSRRVLTEAYRSHKRALLHMPMQPEEGATIDPGEPVVEVGMSSEKIRDSVARALDGLPGVEGLNNHMGSEATRHRREMEPVMELLAQRGMVFLDSQTTPESVAYEVAREDGVPALRNDLFLDVDTTDPELVYERLQRLLHIARRRGWAVGIGHVNEATVTALERLIPTLSPQDVQPVFLSELIHDLSR